jgi:predicted nucleotidyltransferase
MLPKDESAHLSALAERTNLPYSTVHREVDKLEDAGLVTSQRFANVRVVRPDDRSPYIEELRGLLLKAYGPATVLGQLLPKQDVESAYLFGSWAARYHGEPGRDPGDIDVLVVVDAAADLDAVYAAAEEAERILGRPVHVTLVDAERWAAPDSGFLRTIKKRPLVPIERQD